MREILFRGFHADENGTEVVVVNGKEYKGSWVYGYYCKATRHWHKHGIHNDWIITSSFQNGGFFNVMGRYAVIAETVGQYIKSLPYGDKVFSNSKLKIISSVKGENGCSVERIDTAILRFNEKHCEWKLKVSHNGKYKRTARTGYFLNNSDTKVIGTIFDKEEQND